MKSKLYLPVLLMLVLLSGIIAVMILRKINSESIKNEIAQYSGSESCRPCHEKFYQLWHDSHHGLAMQPVSGEFIENNIKSFSKEIKVGEDFFSVSRVEDTLVFTETKRTGTKVKYPAIHTMGGKYVYYFLTPMSGGRLQVLPLAYDCDTDNWYNNPESGVRHFEVIEDAPLDWMSYLYTFNTTCYSCHVSQLETNYDILDNTYETTWREPGINCETCHGPSNDHIMACVKAGEGNVPSDLRIIITGEFTAEQHNASCGSCHAKATLIARDFVPGSKFYDYFDLITLENPDFYADGRDLGENYTMTTWEMNKCAQESDLHCVSCHTSSGRYRFTGTNANDACLPCHSGKVDNLSEHISYMPSSAVKECIACHMPKTEFAMMDRSDHSFRPPMPEATVTFGSPNACNICHENKSAKWASMQISKTNKGKYQEETVKNGLLIRKARQSDWSCLDDIIKGLEEGYFDNVYTTSFIRLLENCEHKVKWPVMIKLTNHDSPLVRGAAAHSMYGNWSERAYKRLTELVNDEYRLVRLNAAYALSSFPSENIPVSDSEKISMAMAEYENSLIVRSDDWSAYYNLGNFYSNMDEFDKALEAYNTSINIFPEAIMPMVNAGFIYSLEGDYRSAEEMFTRALSYAPDHEAALLNLALLYGENGSTELAKQYFSRLMDVTENNSVAAYNLAILESGNDITKAVELSRKAMEWEPGNIKYAYTYAFYLAENENIETAKRILEEIIEKYPLFIDSYILLSVIYSNEGKVNKAIEVLNDALDNNNIAPEEKQALLMRLNELQRNGN